MGLLSCLCWVTSDAAGQAQMPCISSGAWPRARASGLGSLVTPTGPERQASPHLGSVGGWGLGGRSCSRLSALFIRLAGVGHTPQR